MKQSEIVDKFEDYLNHLDYLVHVGGISNSERKTLDEIVAADIKAFETESDTAILVHQIKQSLDKIKDLSLDYENRGFIIDIYSILASSKGFAISRTALDPYYFGL